MRPSACFRRALCALFAVLDVKDLSKPRETINEFVYQDVNKDGKVSREEVRSLLRPGGGAWGALHEFFFRKHDTNGDGHLDWHEYPPHRKGDAPPVYHDEL